MQCDSVHLKYGLIRGVAFDRSGLIKGNYCKYLCIYNVYVFLLAYNHIGGVMVSMLASGAVDFGFEPRSGPTKDYKIGICCFSSKHAALRRKSKY